MCKRDNTAAMGGTVNITGRELLPVNVKPLHYDLTLEPNFDTLKYGGRVIIDLDVVEDSTTVSLHTLELELGDISMTITDTAGAPSTL
jgi:aminopeptidase 2